MSFIQAFFYQRLVFGPPKRTFKNLVLLPKRVRQAYLEDLLIRQIGFVLKAFWILGFGKGAGRN